LRSPLNSISLGGTKEHLRRTTFALALCLVGCGHPQPDLPVISKASRIEVTNNRNERIALIEEPEHVTRILAFIAERRSGWEAPWYGVPVSTVNLVVFQGNSPLLTFGAGGSFFAAQYAGTFGSRAASPEELATFRALLGSAASKSAGP
jgi:hypothetical protein